MGNRSYLYLTHRQGAPDDSREIAEANNNLPLLWHVLLAQGEAAPAITHQRVFGDAGTANIAAEVRPALARYRQLAEALLRHPRLDKLPALPRYLRAVTAFLDACIAEHEADNDLLFSANLDEYSWFYDLSAEEFLLTQQQEFNETWQNIELAITRGDDFGLEKALGLEDDEAFANWAYWCWEIGLGSFSADNGYFDRCDDAPREEEFADFVPQPDPWEVARENDLGLGRQRFADNGYYGVRQVGDGNEPGKILLPAEWEGISTADEAAREELWVQREGLTGLLHLSAEGSTTLLLEPCLEDSWNFADDLAVVRQAGKMGMLRRDGSWFLFPSFDELWDYHQACAIARDGALLGYIDRQGNWLIPPRFSACNNFTAAGVAAVTEAGRQGLLRIDGSYAVPPRYDELQWDEDCDAWWILQQERYGLLHADGRPWIDVAWDEIVFLSEQAGIFAVCRDHRWGLIDAEGRERVPCNYANIEELSPADENEPNSRLRGLIALRESDEHPSTGVWNLDTGKLLVACQYAAITPVFLKSAADPLFLVATPAPGSNDEEECYLGLLKADGSRLFDEDYCWLVSDYRDYAVDLQLKLTGKELSRHWSAGQAIRAGLAGSDEIVCLQPDGQRRNFVAKLADDYAAGDLQAAYLLGKACRDGDGTPVDPEQARLWLERAATGSDERPGLPAAMAELADLLSDDENPQQQVRARQWLDQALSQPGPWDSAAARNLLGHMYLNGKGGPAEAEPAYRLFQLAAEQGNPYAVFNLALCLKQGWGVAPDPARALSHFQKAERKGVADAAYNAGLLLEKSAATEDNPKRQRLMEQAAASQRRELNTPDSRSIGNSCAALARLLQEKAIPPTHPDELPEILETGAQAGNQECREKLLALLENRDSPWHDADRAAHWRQSPNENPTTPPAPSADPTANIRPPRWLAYFILAMAVLVLYRCSS